MIAKVKSKTNSVALENLEEIRTREGIQENKWKATRMKFLEIPPNIGVQG